MWMNSNNGFLRSLLYNLFKKKIVYQNPLFYCLNRRVKKLIAKKFNRDEIKNFIFKSLIKTYKLNFYYNSRLFFLKKIIKFLLINFNLITTYTR